ncbi:MAG: fasciclin domain-containing protein [Acidimicrobiaceae bacterium]
MRSLFRVLALLFSISLLAAACGGDDAVEEAANVVESTDTADSSDEETAEDDLPEEEGPGTIVDVAVGAGSFETLVAAVTEAGLVETLSGEGPFTVFAPTDDAFAAALDALGLTAEELLADTDTLTSILTYHGLLGSVSAEEAIALDGQSVATINGAEIAISVVDGAVVINDSATVIQADVLASNGVIHVIAAVLRPRA